MEQNLIKSEIESRIFTIRGMQVMLDSDLAKLYNVETKALNQTVKRNLERFPESFRFQLSENEMQNLRSQIVTSRKIHGGRRYLPFLFTEQGVAMLSAVLKSSVAVAVSIENLKKFSKHLTQDMILNKVFSSMTKSSMHMSSQVNSFLEQKNRSFSSTTTSTKQHCFNFQKETKKSTVLFILKKLPPN